MSSDRWRQVEDLCHAALARGTEERRPFLVKACEGDEALLREVESLIAQEAGAAAFMRMPAAALAGSTGFENHEPHSSARASGHTRSAPYSALGDGRGLPGA